MKFNNPYLTAAIGLAMILPAMPAAESTPESKTERRELRIVAGPERERRMMVHPGEGRAKPEMEKVAFLGVEVSPVPAVLGAQLGLARGTGLVVGHVAPQSPAAAVLQQHDVLLMLDDQILIEPHQLSVLVRNHKEGDEVGLTYLRGGQKATMRVKLGVQEVPKFSWSESPAAPPVFFPPGGPAERSHVDRLLSLMGHAPATAEKPEEGSRPSARVFVDRVGPATSGVRAMAVNPNIGSLVFSDNEGTLDLTIKDGRKHLVARGPQGEQLFDGSVTTPEERSALPERQRERLEQLEAMRNVTFKTDRDFEGAQSKTVPPLGRRISWPSKLPAPSRGSDAI